ncbi:MAG TPA: aldo/keto reductase [Deinococcales bacterium]|nr:aldo/keto reductase [Deinococcales bacterium]
MATPDFAPDRYDRMQYRRSGRSGLLLPAISLGAWETLGGYAGADDLTRDVLYRAFDLGITHFDLANNYGTPPGNAETVVGRVLKGMPRDELIISSKAGYTMWPGPYGDWGSKKYIVASCDQSLKRMGLEYFDIFYSHRPDPNTPVEETLGALDLLVRQGKALYVGLSNYRGAQFAEAVRVAAELGLRITIHQPRYNMLDRWIETDLLAHTGVAGVGVIPFSPLASGLLSDKYLDGVPAGSRAAEKWGAEWVERNLYPERRDALRDLNALAGERGQTLAQMALAWTLRDPRVTSALIGASSVRQVEDNVAALDNLAFSEEELARIEAILVRQVRKPGA